MKQRMRVLAIVPIGLAAVFGVGMHPTVSLAIGTNGYEIGARGSMCLAGSTTCSYDTGNYSYAYAEADGFYNNRSSGAPSRVDLRCQHDFTTTDGIRHHVYGRIEAYAGTTGESVGGFASAIGDTSEQGTNTLGILAVRASDPSGNEEDSGSGSAQGFFHANNDADGLVSGQATITLHASPGSGFRDYQTYNGVYYNETNTVMSMSCVVSGQSTHSGADAELE